MKGPGKYDDACALVQNLTDGEMVAVIVFHGNKGSGFSVKTINERNLLLLPNMLEFMAAEIRKGA